MRPRPRGDNEELERAGQLGNYRGTDVIGKKGIEKTWEEQLHGRTGLEEVEVTAGGRPMRTLRRIDPVPGSDIMLPGLRVATVLRPQPVRGRHRRGQLADAERIAGPPADQPPAVRHLPDRFDV
ncbi:hypothetical protein G6F31_018358 [Rhizopus arrhizus]|nr:hypothetical protein G6F31_018358 [Rhizopus arrhizus]